MKKNNNKKQLLLGIGNALVDLEFEVDDAFLKTHHIAKGQATLIDDEGYQNIFQILSKHYLPKKQVGGGSAANSVVIFSQLGGQVTYCCRVGDDEFGRFYVHDLKQQGVQCIPAYSSGVTGKCLVLVTPDAERTMLSYLGATADLCVNDIDFSQLKEAEWLLIEGYLATTDKSLSVAKEAINNAKKYGVKIAMSFSDPFVVSTFGTQMTDLLSLGIDCLFANQEEGEIWSKKNTLPEIFHVLHTYCANAIITLGDKGCAVSMGNQPTTPATINYYSTININQLVDTTGAGDSFAGAFLYAIAHGWQEEKAAQLANAMAGNIISQFGARTSRATIESLKASYS